MSQVSSMPRTYEDAIRTLAAWHASQDPDGMAIFSYDDPARERVRLVEVSDSFAATGRVTVFPFGRSADFPFRSSVAQVTRDEWAQVSSGRLALPDDWRATSPRRVYP